MEKEPKQKDKPNLRDEFMALLDSGEKLEDNLAKEFLNRILNNG